MPADRAVVTRDDIAVETRCLKLEETLYRRDETARDLIAHGLPQYRMHHDQIAPAFQPMVDHLRGFAVDIEQESESSPPTSSKTLTNVSHKGKSRTRGKIRTGAVSGTPR